MQCIEQGRKTDKRKKIRVVSLHLIGAQLKNSLFFFPWDC